MCKIFEGDPLFCGRSSFMDESSLPGRAARIYNSCMESMESVRACYWNVDGVRPANRPAIAVGDINSRFTHSVFGVAKIHRK